MPKITKRFERNAGTRRFDARPDRVDFRDRAYRPALVSLPPEYPDPDTVADLLRDYTSRLILNQGEEGACTGFGLAAVINYLRYRLGVEAEARNETVDPPARVSERMLYHLARIYDEWEGEGYDGSSCRGAMKGWHRHGVCRRKTWPYRDKNDRAAFVPPTEGWQGEAALVPLGAYYRIDKDSIADMQAAICEVGAIYVSAEVHDGWDLVAAEDGPPLIDIPTPLGETGGHAFAIVGYTPTGFIVQNSWGPGWGFQGFAVMQYRDWIERGMDAWVAVLGAPIALHGGTHEEVDLRTQRTRSSVSLRDAAAGRATWFWSRDRARPSYPYHDSRARPWPESRAYEHTVVLGNNGVPLNRFLDVETAGAALKRTVSQRPGRHLGRSNARHLLIYAHGGLNDEAASIRRIRTMAPYFLHNDIYPLFVTWRTGFKDSLSGMLEDEIMPSRAGEPAGGIFDRLSDYMDRAKQKLADARDRSVELARERLLVKPIWMQMKQNAAAGERHGLAAIARGVRRLVEEVGDMEIHLVGHSAGSILHGHLLECLARQQLNVATCTLFAPACTLRFALDHYGRRSSAVRRGILDPAEIYVENLSERRKRGDSVGPYGKSLLYLVSRALEDVHKMPLLGMQAAWREVGHEDLWYVPEHARDGRNPDVVEWRKYAARLPRPRWLDDKQVSDGQGLIDTAHGSFDNDVDAITRLIRRIRRGRLRVPVESLRGF